MLRREEQSEPQPQSPNPTGISSRISAGIGAVGSIPPPPAELGWLAILGVAISLYSLIKKGL